MDAIFAFIEIIAMDVFNGDGKGGWVDPDGKAGWDEANGKAGW